MGKFEIRRQKLLALIGPNRGDAAAFARRYGQDAGFISQIINGHRNFGEKAAAKMAEECGLAADYFESAPGAEGASKMDKIRQAINEADWMDDKAKANFISLIEGMKGGSGA